MLSVCATYVLCTLLARCLCILPAHSACALCALPAHSACALCVFPAHCAHCLRALLAHSAYALCALYLRDVCVACAFCLRAVHVAYVLYMLPSEAHTASDRVATKSLPTICFPSSPYGCRANPWDYVSFGHVWEGLKDPPPPANVDALVDLFLMYSCTCFSNCHKVTSFSHVTSKISFPFQFTK